MNTPSTPAIEGSAMQAPAVEEPQRRRRGRPFGSLTKVHHPQKSQEQKEKERRKRQEKKLAISQRPASDLRPTIDSGLGHQAANYPQPTVDPGVGQQASTNPQRTFHPGLEQQAPQHPQPAVNPSLGQLPTSLEVSATTSDEPSAFANLDSEAPSLGSSTSNFQAPMENIRGSGDRSEQEPNLPRGNPIRDLIASLGLAHLSRPASHGFQPSNRIVPASWKSRSTFIKLSVAQIAQIAHELRMAEAPSSPKPIMQFRDGTINPELLMLTEPSDLDLYTW